MRPVLGSQSADNAAWQEVAVALYNASGDGATVPALTVAEADSLAAAVVPILARLVDSAGAAATLLLERAESYQRDAGVIRQSGQTAEAVAYETIAAELRRVAEEVGK